MRLLKKSVSVILSLVMVVSVFAAVPFVAAAETLDVTTWEQLRLAIYYGRSAVLGADITVNTTFTGGTYTLMRAGSFEGVENLASWSDSPKVTFFVSSDGKSLQMSIFSGTTIIFR